MMELLHIIDVMVSIRRQLAEEFHVARQKISIIIQINCSFLMAD